MTSIISSAILVSVILVLGSFCPVFASSYTFTNIDVGSSLSMDLNAINNHDQIVGDAFGIGGYADAFLYSSGKFTNFLPGSGTTIPFSINNRGDIVGTYNYGVNRFLRYSSGTVKKIDLPGAFQTRPMYINDHRDIVGIYINNDKEWHGFVSYSAHTL